jgi:polysaccharide export outer membrane protein
MLLVISSVIGFLGCASQPEQEIDLRDMIPYREMVPHELTLIPGDQINIKFANTPEFDDTQNIRPDGVITIQFIGEICVEGKTPLEVRRELREALSRHLKNPELEVIVRELANRKVYVSGAVTTPGAIEMPVPISALEAIMEAGGFDLDTAELSNVLLIRHRDGKRYGGALDFDGVLAGETPEPFYLEPNDIVYVPENRIVKIGRWIDQHINQIIPLGVTFTQTRGRTTVGLDTGGTRVSSGR